MEMFAMIVANQIPKKKKQNKKYQVSFYTPTSLKYYGHLSKKKLMATLISFIVIACIAAGHVTKSPVYCSLDLSSGLDSLQCRLSLPVQYKLI